VSAALGEHDARMARWAAIPAAVREVSVRHLADRYPGAFDAMARNAEALADEAREAAK
jgi:hypothetical protein